MSGRLIPAAATRIRTSPGPGCGTGRVASRNCSGPPGAAISITLMCMAFLSNCHRPGSRPTKPTLRRRCLRPCWAHHECGDRTPRHNEKGRSGCPERPLAYASDRLLLVRVVAEGNESHADVGDGIATDAAERLALEIAVLQADLEVADLALVHLPPFS